MLNEYQLKPLFKRRKITSELPKDELAPIDWNEFSEIYCE